MSFVDAIRLFVIGCGTIVILHGVTELVELMGRHASTILTRLSLVLFTFAMLIDMGYRLRSEPTWRLWIALAAVLLGLGGIVASHRKQP